LRPETMKKKLLFFLMAAVLLASCSEYSKVLKSTDIEYKYSKAVEYHNNEEYFKALPILDELITLTRGTQRAEDVYYYYAKCHFGVKDYYMANYFFKNFAKVWSHSARSEECLFLAAICSARLSPEPSLDQTDTKAALDEFQLFIDTYPNSTLRDSCNNMMRSLNVKLEEKNFEIAKLYERTEKWKSAGMALRGFLKEYPESRFKEEAMYLIVRSEFEYAERSIESKKLERYRSVLETYTTFASLFPESKWLREAEVYNLRSRKQVEKITSGTIQ
jgi:outer membrane protein assembly factor BamD